jgi:hypothetical protein
MAQKLNIDIVARDKSKQALNSVQGSLSKVKNAVFNLQNAFIGLGVGVAVRSLVNTGKQIEGLQVRLKFLFGTAKEGSKAFDEMAKFASKVPFSLEEIQAGSGVLSVVSKDAKELANLMEITGNVAAVTGLDFRTTAEQIQRSMSAGISAADLFRDRGVKAMLGFKAGATVTVEETADAFQKIFGKGGKYGKATDELAKTFEGTMSMIGDSFFNLKRSILDAGFFEELKIQFQALDNFIKTNEETFNEFARTIGEGLASAVRGTVEVLKFMKENINLIVASVKLLIAFKLVTFFYNLATAIGVATMAMRKFNLATKKNIIIGGAALLLSQLNNIVKKLREIGLLESERKFADVPGSKVHEGMDIKKAIPESTFMDKVLFQANVLKKTFADVNATVLENMKNKFNEIGETIARGINAGITKMSKSLAESIILGKDLMETFKVMAQQIMINILSHLIEMAARMVIDIALNKQKTEELAKQNNLMRKNTTEMKRQIVLNALGGGGGGIPFFAKGGAVSKGQPIVVGEQGAELFIPNQTGQITQSARGTGVGGGTTVNFNINTVDASGFEELLVRSRGTITQLINNAVNERGKESLI